MRRLRDVSPQPPQLDPQGGFRYVHGETGHETMATDHYTWWIEIQKYRIRNGFPAITLADAEDQLCSCIPPEWCLYEKGDSPPVSTSIGLGDLVNGAKALWAFIVKGDFVSQEEADRRARICASCYYNVHISGCGACNQFAQYITKDRSTQYDNQLKNCAVCKCPGKSQVHLSLTTLESVDTSERQSQYPSHCWKLKTGINYQLTLTPPS